MLFVVAFPSVSWMLLSCMTLPSQVQGEDLQKEQPLPKITCPTNAVAFQHFCYALYTTPKTWMDAEIDCQRQTLGHLVSVLSGSEASFVSSLIKNTWNGLPNVWIGLHDPTEGLQPNGGGWQWTSGDVLNYFAWDQCPPRSPDSGYCATVSHHTGYEKWINFNCDWHFPYVCKFKY